VRVLLDTHSLIWYAQDNPKLSVTANLAIENPGNIIYVSIVSLWEITIKNKYRQTDYGPANSRFLRR
jgi:PIN domain nuclease of toxin-antitoxin system